MGHSVIKSVRSCLLPTLSLARSIFLERETSPGSLQERSSFLAATSCKYRRPWNLCHARTTALLRPLSSLHYCLWTTQQRGRHSMRRHLEVCTSMQLSPEQWSHLHNTATPPKYVMNPLPTCWWYSWALFLRTTPSRMYADSDNSWALSSTSHLHFHLPLVSRSHEIVHGILRGQAESLGEERELRVQCWEKVLASCSHDPAQTLPCALVLERGLRNSSTVLPS